MIRYGLTEKEQILIREFGPGGDGKIVEAAGFDPRVRKRLECASTGLSDALYISVAPIGRLFRMLRT